VASEARRGIIRILTNYARLVLTLAAGIVLVPVLISWVGADAFGLIMLVGASVGFPAVIQDVMRRAMTQPLGAAVHSGDDDRFRSVYASAFVVSIGAAALTAVAFLAVIAIVPYLKIDSHFIGPMRWMLCAEGAYTVSTVLFAPVVNMYNVQERFAVQNGMIAIGRLSYLTAALVLWLGFGVTQVETAITLYSVVAASLNILVVLLAAGWQFATRPLLRPSFANVERASIREVLHTSTWVTLVTLAINVQGNVGALLMNLGFGLFGNTIYGLARRLSGYARMAIIGVTYGLDAVAARIASDGDDDGMLRLFRNSTRVHAFIAAPASVCIFLLADPMLNLWVGRQIQDTATYLPPAAEIVKVLSLGLVAAGVGEGWTKLLYGAGHIRRYAPVMVLGGVANPIFAGVLFFLLPESFRHTFVAWAYTIVFVGINFLSLPRTAARLLHAKYLDIMAPMARPILCSLLPIPILFAPQMLHTTWTLPALGIVLSLYGALYMGLSWAFVLDARERLWITRAIRRRLGLWTPPRIAVASSPSPVIDDDLSDEIDRTDVKSI
jgi:O-antigen/teichoic acid export membrane protein